MMTIFDGFSVHINVSSRLVVSIVLVETSQLKELKVKFVYVRSFKFILRKQNYELPIL